MSEQDSRSFVYFSGTRIFITTDTLSMPDSQHLFTYGTFVVLRYHYFVDSLEATKFAELLPIYIMCCLYQLRLKFISSCFFLDWCKQWTTLS